MFPATRAARAGESVAASSEAASAGRAGHHGLPACARPRARRGGAGPQAPRVRPAGRRTRRGLPAAIGLLTALLALGLVDGVLAIRDLQRAEQHASGARHAVASGSLRAAVASGEEAAKAASAAHQRLARGHWGALRRVPLIGREVAAIRALAATVAATGDLVAPLLETTAPLLDTDAISPDGQIDLTVLRAIADRLDAADPAELGTARSLLTTTADASRSTTIREVADEVLTATEEVLGSVEPAHEAAALLVDLLGGNGPRSYLVAIQNPGELRGTGGLIGFLAVLDVDEGRITLAEPDGIDAQTGIDGTVLMPLGAFSGETRFTVEAPAAYRARYGRIGGAHFLPSTNVDPDLPTVAPLILEQYRQAGGGRLDGLLVLDPFALQLLFEAIGPFDVPETAATMSPQLPDPIPAERIAEVLLIDSYEVLGGGSEQRRRYHAEVAGAALQTVTSSAWEPLAVGRALSSAIAGRHLQFHSAEVATQRHVQRWGAAGGLQAATDGDLRAVTVVNIGGNKADVHVAHEVDHEIELEVVEDGNRRALWHRTRSQLRITNAVDVESDPYVSTSLQPTRPGEPRVLTGERGAVRSWVTFWTAPGTSLEQVHDLAGAPASSWRDEIHGLETVDVLLDTPNQATTGVASVLRGPTRGSVGDTAMVYPLTIWRQAKGVVDHLELTIAAPAGWQISDVAVAGDGPTVGLGPAPYVEPVRVRAQRPDVVRIGGSMTADVEVVVRLVPWA